jgi:triphosphatase
VVVGTEASEGPHQLRIGMRRLRTAFAVFGESLGKDRLAPLSDVARDLGQAVGRLRDLDVLIEEVVGGAAALGLDAPAHEALKRALSARRDGVRAEVRAALTGPEATVFVIDLLELIEARGWLAPADYSQTERLAAPIGSVAPALLAKRHRKAMRMGRRIETLDAEALHELRKELKKLRYTADVLDPIFPGKKVDAYLKALRDMQDTFGSLNDATMAMEYLAGPEAPARTDPDAQRAVGWTLGTLTVKVGDDRPMLFRRWADLAKTDVFWN